MSPLVQQRLSKTLGWFSYGIASTTVAIYAMRNSLIWASIPWYVVLGGSIVFGVASHSLDYETAFPLKVAAYTAFTGIMGLAILPAV